MGGMHGKKCEDCGVAMTRRVTFSNEVGRSTNAITRCGTCYLRNRRSFRFRRTVKELMAQIGEDLVIACILEATE